MSEQPWTKHDGGPMPVEGWRRVQIRFHNEEWLNTQEFWRPHGDPDDDRADVWDWTRGVTIRTGDIEYYRIIKPKGIQILEDIAKTAELENA